MNLIINLENIYLDNIFFYEPVKNTILESSYFIRIIFSNEDVILNGIYIFINLNENIDKNIKAIEELELNILNKFRQDKNIVKKLNHIELPKSEINC